MSWMKRGAAGAGPGPQPYAAPQAQPFGNQQNTYPNYPAGTDTTPAQPLPQAQPQQQQFWQMPPQQAQQQQYNQQYGQPYQQEVQPNANQHYQQGALYNQNYANQAYANPQPNYQQNFYQNQPTPQQNFSKNTGNADGWEDNWDWGWEESAKKAHSAQMQSSAQQPALQQQMFNNANVIEESFASTNSWNWAMDEKKESKASANVPLNQEHIEPPILPAPPAGNNVTPEPVQNNVNNQQTEEVKTLSDREVVNERLPNLALGKRFHLENLTPQWSIESQMSQDSSDGPQTHSEGTYRSENQSRNSSSPGPNTDNSNSNYAQQGFDETHTQNSEWSKNSEEPTAATSRNNSRRESHDELSNSLKEMSIGSHEYAPRSSIQAHLESTNMKESVPPPTVSPPSFPPPVSGSAHQALSMPPPPPVSTQASPLAPQPSQPPSPAPHPSQPALPRPPSSSSTSSLGHSQSRPPLTSSPATLPPSIPPPTNSQNPFQRAGPLSHRSTAKLSSSAQPQAQPFPPATMSGAGLVSPTVVNKLSQQNRAPVGFEANLETTPDNSERPDQPQAPFRPTPVPLSIPDNMEVAPQNDRNEYLQTAHLSSSDYGENTDFTRNLPPPGLRRMVVGQQEPEYQNLNISGDEPPPGLSRMVPGQQTEGDGAYTQPGGDYMDRLIDGQLAGGGRPFRQADGQQLQDTYPPAAGRPAALHRMVPGEPSNDEYSQYQASNFASNEQRVVTGLDRDYPVQLEGTPSNVREQNMDGADYSGPPPRNVLGAREPPADVSQEYSAPPDEQQREVTVEGENLQDLSVISSADLTYSREQLDGVEQSAAGGADGSDAPDATPAAASSRKPSLNRVHSSGDDSERDRAFKSSPRRDRHKASRDRDRVRDRDRDKEGRYSRGDRKYDREDRRPRDDKRPDKDRRDRDRDRGGALSPDARKHRHSTRSRKYETEDTDYYSDRERDRRRYTSKPPRPEDRDRERDRRHNTSERDRPRDPPRDRDRDRDRDRYERKYRDIDPYRTYGNLRRERDDDERRRVTFSSDTKSNDSRSEGEMSRAESGEAGATDEEAPDARRGAPRARRSTRRRREEPYYDGYGAGAYADPYELQRQQYEYYEQLRVRDPAAYLLVYKQLMAGRAPPAPAAPPPQYRASQAYPGVAGYEERGSVHSGRSSATGLKGNDTFYVCRHDAGSPRDAPSLRTDVSDRDLATDASLNLQLEESTVRSERMTPFRYSTAHVKGSIGSRDIVVVPAAYPVDGAAATVQLVSLAAARAADPEARELAHAPSPLLQGVTHKKSVIDYCMVRVRNASREGARDVIGYVLVWELLALMLRQNGVVVGSDIGELLMNNTREYECQPAAGRPARSGTHESRRGSSLSGSLQEDPRNSASPAPQNKPAPSETVGGEAAACACAERRAALDTYREYLLYGNRHEALEWAMNNGLWGHALQLSAAGDRRARAAVSARFLSAVPRADPLHTLYAALAGSPYVCEAGGEWRTHAAMLVANPSPRPDHDASSLIALGDTLAGRGQVYSAQFCYISAGVPFARHPLAPLSPPPAPASPPRLSLLLAEPKAATLSQLATTRAILATEIYEYAKSLSAPYVIPELQVYKMVMACRLVDAGLYARALACVEVVALAAAGAPALYSRALVLCVAELADRLKYHDPALTVGVGEGGEEGADSAEGSPQHHRWIDDVTQLARTMQAESAEQRAHHAAPHAHAHAYGPHAWTPQAQQYQTPDQTYTEPEGTPNYQQYYQPPAAPPEQPPAEPPAPYGHPADPYPGQYAGPPAEQHAGQPAEQYGQAGPDDQPPQYSYEDWNRTEETHSQSYGDSYWRGDAGYGYGEGAGEEASPRPTITMPGAAPAGNRGYGAYDDDRPASAASGARHNASGGEGAADTPKPAKDNKSKEEKDARGRSWIGGILTKLSLRPPNQMILPDDKNPTIVWDAAAKRWRNTDGGEEEADKPPPPPPRTQDLPPHRSGSPPLQAGPPAAAAAAPPVANIFKMQKGRHIKKSYVDVFNPSGAETRALPPPAAVLPPAPAPPPANYFVPAPPHVNVSMPASLRATPLPSPIPDPDPDQSGAYDPSAAADDQYRSGI